MYIDSLTIAAMIVFVIALIAFINFCMIRVCGLASKAGYFGKADNKNGKHS